MFTPTEKMFARDSSEQKQFEMDQKPKMAAKGPGGPQILSG